MGFYPRKITPGTLQGDEGGSVDRAFVVDYKSTPVLADDDRLAADAAMTAAETTTVSTFLAQPDVPRTIEVLPGGTTADVPAGDVTINGTDANGQTISEALTFAANATTKQTTTKAFASVTSVVFPVQDGASAATYDIGIGLAIGLYHVITDPEQMLFNLFDGADDAGSITTNADVAKNLFTAAGTFDGAKQLRLLYVA